MVSRRSIEALLEREWPPSLTEFKNAHSAVSAWISRATDPMKRPALQALLDRIEALPAPEEPQPMSRDEALAKGRAANESRIIGRCRTQLVEKLARSRWGRVSVSSDKPFLFEAALQLIEDGEVSFQSSQVGGRRGPERAAERSPLRRVWIGPKDVYSEWSLEWKSSRRQEEEGRI